MWIITEGNCCGRTWKEARLYMFSHTKGREIITLPRHSASRTNTLSDNLARELALCVLFIQLTHTSSTIPYSSFWIWMSTDEQAAGKSTAICCSNYSRAWNVLHNLDLVLLTSAESVHGTWSDTPQVTQKSQDGRAAQLPVLDVLTRDKLREQTALILGLETLDLWNRVSAQVHS